tara:strand:+ start:9051 stop:9725 length:675 start_codon:yes stop_codon:yes gene_type:complete
VVSYQYVAASPSKKEIMIEILEKLKSILSIFGMKLDMFPGIPIALIPIYFFVNHFKEEVLIIIRAEELNESAQTVLIMIIILILAITLWKASGFLLDWIYDLLSPQKRNKESDLNRHIKQAREKWAERNPIYKSENVSIYGDTIKLLEESDQKGYNDVKLILAASKFFRILVIPTLGLSIVNFTSNQVSIGIILLMLGILFLMISFSFRAEQSRKLYNWFIMKG